MARTRKGARLFFWLRLDAFRFPVNTLSHDCNFAAAGLP
jgi:hypothetical protein